MKLHEDIEFSKEKSKNIKLRTEPKTFEQIAEWMEELKQYRAIGTVEECKNSVLKILEAYNKAIDDFVKEICKMIVQSENNDNYRFYAVEIKQAIADLAEQLKAGGINE